ncbi:hypothetical protein ACPXB3_21505 [Gordonia sp. DT219]|uniref:hypothetical protein n=1 Tax=Gordonia sp. DT219 TaxID=3416658 RepID=UPI003CEEC900
MATYEISDLNGETWEFGSDSPLHLMSLKGIDGAEFSLDTLHGVGQRGVTVVGSDFKEGQIVMTVALEPFKAGLRGDDAVDLVSRWRDGLGEGEAKRGDNEFRFYVVDSGRYQIVRLVKRGNVDWERVKSNRFCKDEITMQSDESDWRTDPNTYTFTVAEFAGAVVANGGTVDSWPHFKLTGPIVGPTVGLAGEAVKLPDLAAGEHFEIETDPNWYAVTDEDGVDVTFDLYTLADGADDRWRKQAPARTPDIPVTITGTGTSAATKLDVVVPQIYRSAL